MKKQAFTLVELIVVITILAILGTIAFISLQGYSAQARDSVRISDLGSMKKALELFRLKNSTYPSPSNFAFDVSYSGSKIWTQGFFGETVIQELQNISTSPLDPLTSTQYTYSLLNTDKEFELGSIMEGVVSKNIASKVNAAGTNIGKAYITGNYNGQMAKVQTGSTTIILAVPSIIGSDTESDYGIISSANKLVLSGKNNLPASYETTDFNTTAGTGETIVNGIVLFSGDMSTLTDAGGSAVREAFLTDLQNAYTGTVIASSSAIESLLAADPADDNYASTLINNNLGGNLAISSGGGSGGSVGGCVFGTSTFGNCTFQ